jgi:hypothetical protein
MTATNHALTGAIIGLTVHNPWLAVPAALVSHLVCDVIPHFGSADKNILKKRRFVNYLFVDAFLCGLLVVLLALTHPAYWWLGAVCAFVAASPDFLSIRRFVTVRRGKKFVYTKLERFLKQIQWFERPIGAVVEVAWLVGCLTVLSAII